MSYALAAKTRWLRLGGFEVVLTRVAGTDAPCRLALCRSTCNQVLGDESFMSQRYVLPPRRHQACIMCFNLWSQRPSTGSTTRLLDGVPTPYWVVWCYC